MINKRLPSLVPVIALAAGFALVGCKKKEPEPAPKAAAAEPAPEAEAAPAVKRAEAAPVGETKTLTKKTDDTDDDEGGEDGEDEGDE